MWLNVTSKRFFPGNKKRMSIKREKFNNRKHIFFAFHLRPVYTSDLNSLILHFVAI
jgi:hypothetical protein